MNTGYIFLRTERLYLRRFTAADVPLLFELDSDPEVMRHISKGLPTPLETIEREILPSWLRMYELSDHLGIWAAHETATDRFIGWFHLRPDRYAPDDQELGYRLRRESWGRGYATEGSRALIEKSFQEWWVERIVARTLVGNATSRRVMEKCGLRFEEFFTYPPELLPGWTEEERAAVKYGLRRTGR
jgi:RimJ/RimL family protein N-acetyltransferase